MKKIDKNTSSEKENKKVQTDKQFKDDEVREDENNSIYKEANDKSAYPYKVKMISNIKISLNLLTGIVNQKIRAEIIYR